MACSILQLSSLMGPGLCGLDVVPDYICMSCRLQAAEINPCELTAITRMRGSPMACQLGE
jgi:hypothetical protein